MGRLSINSRHTLIQATQTAAVPVDKFTPRVETIADSTLDMKVTNLVLIDLEGTLRTGARLHDILLFLPLIKPSRLYLCFFWDELWIAGQLC